MRNDATEAPGSPHRAGRGLLVGSRDEYRIGIWSARVIIVVNLAYVVVIVAGFASIGNLRDPLPDPYLAVAELMILVLAPVMVMLLAVVHVCAPPHRRLFSLTAFGWMLLAAGLTMMVHLVELTVARRVDPASVPGFPRLFDFAWPSMLYAIDVVARGTCCSGCHCCLPRPCSPARGTRWCDGGSCSAARCACSGCSARPRT